jgi:hypothetical protein
MEFKPKISATTIEEFNEINIELNKLPKSVYNQIESAGKGIVGIKCTFRNTFKAEQTIYLPNNVTSIKDFGDTIGIYSKNLFFEIGKEIRAYKLEYYFVPMEAEDIKPGI